MSFWIPNFWMSFHHSPNSACTEGVPTAFQETVGGELGSDCGGRTLILIRKNAYLVTLALVSSRRNRGLRAQTSIFTIENQHFLVQMAPQTGWQPSLPADCLQARSLQPGVLSQGSSARNPQPGILSQESLKVPLRVLLRVPSP